MKYIIAGASGLIGTELTRFLKNKNHTVKRLVRHSENLQPDEIFWDPENHLLDPQQLEGSDVIINLAGDNISSGRWTADKKEKILQSRISATQTIVRTIAQLDLPPEVLVNASAVGYYGSRGSDSLPEESLKGTGFLSDVCAQWEAAAGPAQDKGVRVVLLRTGVVLTQQGGALSQMLKAFKLGLGGVIGSGEQFMSWITLDDLIQVIYFLSINKNMQGPVNAVAPHPVTNAEFTKELGHCLHRPTILNVPAFAARLAFGEMADEMLLASTRVEPQKLISNKFHFVYPSLELALQHLFP